MEKKSFGRIGWEIGRGMRIIDETFNFTFTSRGSLFVNSTTHVSGGTDR